MVSGAVESPPACVFNDADISSARLKASLQASAAGVKNLISKGLMPTHQKFINHLVMRRAPDVDFVIHEKNPSWTLVTCRSFSNLTIWLESGAFLRYPPMRNLCRPELIWETISILDSRALFRNHGHRRW